MTHKRSQLLATILLSITLLTSCRTNCDPGIIPEDDIFYISILNPNGSSYIKYGTTLPDSFKVTNLSTNAPVNRFLFNDSIIIVEGWNKTNGATTAFKITKGTVLKPDTITVTVARTIITNVCGEQYDVSRFGTVRGNSTTLCTGGTCRYNELFVIRR